MKELERRVIVDFSKQKRFSSFLPAISGVDGKPTWVFYANVGQCIASFGVDSKDNPLIPFDSAYLAYQNIPLKCFRTLIFIDGKLYQPFLDKGKTKLEIYHSFIKISYENDSFEMNVTYATSSHVPYAGLIRKVEIINKSEDIHTYDIIDGLPIYLPKGLSNYMYHELTTLAASYCMCTNDDNAPWYIYTNHGEDNSEFVEREDGSGFVSLNESSQRLTTIVDPKVVFGDDESFRNPLSISEIKNRLFNQEISNKIPCAFSYQSKALINDGKIEFVSFFGAFEKKEEYLNFAGDFSYQNLIKMILSGEEIVNDLLPTINTNSSSVNSYLRQSFLDNGLRGGFPIKIDDKILYLYSRKHGDLERDYNSFLIQSTFFSSGYGNFRDINQNRRNDLLIEPLIKDENIFLFFSLIENNGFNPLQVDISLLHKDHSCYEDALEEIRSINKNDIHAKYIEGYWIDHWTYNTDLIENYLTIYPDKVNELFTARKYRFFDSGIHIKDRKERYVLTKQGIRQYRSLEKLENCNSDWLLNKDNRAVEVNLASKVFDLILKKVVTLDVNQMGLEMISDKPGWNDSCNGLPGLFASSTPEAIELLRLIRLFKKLHEEHQFPIELTKASSDLFQSVLTVNCGGFSLWNELNKAREEFENKYRKETDLIKISFSDTLQFLNKYELIIADGLAKATLLGKGIIPTYFVHELTKYDVKDGYVIAKEFVTKPLTPFLEGPARLLKLGSEYMTSSMIHLVEKSELCDKELKIFKTSASLEKESKEIGRVRLFQPGWLERESDFLHMSLKYLLGCLNAGYYDEFFKYAKTNIPCFMDEKVYGRPNNENVSFIVPTNHPNKLKHGSGHYARLTGANTEVINMYQLIFFGKEIIKYHDGQLSFNFKPHIPLELFNKNNELVVSLFGIPVRYINPLRKDYKNQMSVVVTIDGKSISSNDISRIRDRTYQPKEIVATIK